ncbi:MAG TPA: response regulator [Asticcacaulis sp.]|nr:response regulator [Asticcacaulis sp.]
MHTQTQRLLNKVDCARISILVVEDNDASRRLVLELLRAAGFDNLSFARDAEEAIEQIQGHSPDLMLLDWGLPGMSGVELVREIRSSAHKPDGRFANPELPIVMLTARQRARDVTTARNAGINEFVIKPFSATSLLKAISSCLARQRDFVVARTFTGPDRRRRRAENYPGLLRRESDIVDALASQRSDMFRETLTAELESLRSFMRARGGLDRRTLNHLVSRLLQAERQAHDVRLRLIEQATRSLNDYINSCGEHADAEILDVHLDALIKLNQMPVDGEAEAANVVRHLDKVVAKRRPKKVS